MPFIEYNGQKIAFIHIPRTGGTTIEHWLRQHGILSFYSPGIPFHMKITPQHCTRNDLFAVFGNSFFNYMFTIVRDPIKRLESEYKLQYITSRRGYYKDFTNFASWIEINLNAFHSNPYHADNHFRRQTDFINRDVQVFRFEDGVDSNLALVARTLDLPTPEPAERHYDTSEFDGTIEWDLASQARVEEVYRRDFDILGYPGFNPDSADGLSEDKQEPDRLTL